MKKKEKSWEENSKEKNTLPLTRWELLKDFLHYRSFELAALSLLTVVFLFPSFIWLVWANLSSFYDSGNLYSVMITYGVNAPLFAILGIGEAGAFYFVRKSVFGEGSSLPGDFFLGIKKNRKRFTCSFFLLGILYFVLRTDIAMLRSSESLSGWGLGALEGVSYACFFIFVSLILFMLPQDTVYTGSYFSFLVNSVRFFVSSFLSSLPIMLAFLVPFCIFEFVPYATAQYISIIFEGVFYFGFSALFLFIYSCSLFDKSINRKQYPEMIRKGLRKKD